MFWVDWSGLDFQLSYHQSFHGVLFYFSLSLLSSAKKMVHRDEAHLEEVVKNLGKDPIPLIRVHTLT